MSGQFRLRTATDGLDPGKMDRKLVIESATVSSDEFGSKETWATFATVWAEYEPLGGSEIFEAYGFHSKRAARFRIHPLSGLTLNMRIDFDGVKWKILGTREIGYKAGIELDAEAIL